MKFHISRHLASFAAAGFAWSLTCGAATAANASAVVDQPLTFQAYDNARFPTFAFGMAKNGTVVGYYYNASYDVIGYLRAADGTYTDLVYPKTPEATYAQTINNKGNVAGYGQITGFSESYGWFYDAAAQSFTPIEVPRAQATNIWGMNNQNVVAGTAYFYRDNSARAVGFTWTNGTFKYYNIPDAMFTQIYAINDNGDVAGSYIEADGTTSHNFFWKADGTVSTSDTVNEFNNAVGISAINKKGDSVGLCYDQNSVTMGCFHKQSNGKVTSFRLDGFRSTMPFGMSNGDIIGYGTNASTGMAQAFVVPKSLVVGK